MPQVRLTLLVGSYALRHRLGKGAMTEQVRRFGELGPAIVPLPHPSWRTTGWERRNPWFGEELLFPHAGAHGEWGLDLASRALTSPAGAEIRLTTGEFELLAAFVNHANQVLSRDRLLDLSRHREAGPFDRTIDVQVGRLRRKLEDDPKNPTMIKTVRGGGYIFTPEVTSG